MNFEFATANRIVFGNGSVQRLPEAIKNARSRVVLQGTGDWLESLLPENLDTYITNILKKKPKGDEQDEPPPDQRGEWPTAAPHWS